MKTNPEQQEAFEKLLNEVLQRGHEQGMDGKTMAKTEMADNF